MILDEGGQPVHRATVSWTPFDLFDALSPTGFDSLERWNEVSAKTRSGSSGRYELELQDLSSDGVLWITKPGYTGVGSLVRADQLGQFQTARLGRSAPIRIEVRSALGQPVPDATVRLHGSSSLVYPRPAGAVPDLTPFLLRTATTDSNGLTEFGALKDWVSLVAASGPLKSVPREINKAGTYILVVESQLPIQGAIRGLPTGQPAYCTVIHLPGGKPGELLAVLPVQRNAEVSPHSISRRSEGTYRIQLEGPGLAPRHVDFEAKRVGDGIWFELDALGGIPLAVNFVDSDEQPIEGVQTYVSWAEQDGFFHATLGKIRSDKDGQVRLHAPSSPVDVVYSHPDYFPSRHNDILLSQGEGAEEDNRLTIELQSFGRLLGVVLGEGGPVANYKLHYYPASAPASLQVLAVADSEDGSFSIERAPVGELELFAVAPGLPQSEVLTTDVQAGAESTIEVHIPDQGLGVGRVLDAATGQPLPGCNVDRYLHGANGAGVALAYEEHRTDSDGRFSFLGFGAGLEQIWVTESEHAGAVGQASRGPDGRFDFGVIRLGRTSTLTLEFNGPEDFTGYSYRIQGAANVGPVAIPPNGVAQLEGVLPSPAILYVDGPEGFTRQFGLTLNSRGPWTERISIKGQGRLHVSITGLEEGDLQGARLVLRPDTNPLVEKSNMYIRGDLSSSMDLSGLPTAPLTLTVIRADESTLATANVGASEQPRNIVLDAGVSEQAFQVVNRDGAPWVGVLWTLSFVGTTAVGPTGRSDQNGLCRVRGLTSPTLQLILTGPDGQHSTTKVITLGPLDKPTQVVFDASSSLDLLAVDHGKPLDGVKLSIRDALSGAALGWPTTDANGKATFGNVTEGEVLISPHATSIWYETVVVSTSATPTLETLEFRRIGSLTVTVLNAYGKPEVGAFVAIASDEYGTDVETWLSEQRVSSASGLVTDDEGQVHIEGLPNGAYTIYVRGESRAALVPPLGDEKIAIKLTPQ